MKGLFETPLEPRPGHHTTQPHTHTLLNTNNSKATCHYPLVNSRNYGKSQFLKGKSTIKGHFQ